MGLDKGDWDMGALIDLTGQRFGRLVVTCRAENKGKETAWLCKCDCGNTKIATGGHLKSGLTQSCGCLQKERAANSAKNNLIDLTGKVYGRLTVISRAENKNGRPYWNCLCECGNITCVSGGNLHEGNVRSCGCLTKERLSKRLIDLTGMKFGRLTVLRRTDDYITPKGMHQTKWLCQCECGNITEVVGNRLTGGYILSCGCYAREVASKTLTKDLVGKKFGKLTVIERDLDKKEKVYWRCLCSCGKRISVAAEYLSRLSVMSCGCSKTSKGETLIIEYLDVNHIDYQKEYKFTDCIDKRELPFDFYVPSFNTLIEVQGQQHYEPVDFAGRGKEWAEMKFAVTQKHDKIKRDYCQEHNIKLIRIPYTEFDNIEKILSENLS